MRDIARENAMRGMEHAVRTLASTTFEVALHHDKGRLVLHQDEYQELQGVIDSLKDLVARVYRDDRLQQVEERD